MSQNKEKVISGWLAENGFDSEGYTYILIGLDSYSIKDQLKENGWKYNQFLRWHKENPGIYENNVVKVHWSELYSASAWGKMYPFEDTQKKVDAMIEAAKAPSTSEWLGEPGERLKDIPVTLISIHGFEGRYGYSEIYNFIDEEGDKLTWFTSSCPDMQAGSHFFLTATVKKHDIYKNEKITVITRAKVQSR